MRWFAETPEWWPRSASDTVADASFKMSKVEVSACADASKRNLVFRIFEASPHATVYAFRNFDDASAADTNNDADDLLAANKVLAYSQNFTAVGSAVTGLTLTNNAAYGVDMSDLRIEYTGTLAGSSWDKYYTYTDNIAEATLRKIKSVLHEYVASTAALEQFDVFGIEYARGGRVSRNNQLLIRYGDIRPSTGSQCKFSSDVNFQVEVFMVGRNSQDDFNSIEHQVMMFAQRVMGILGDERRTLDGFCNIGIEITSVSEPQILDKEGAGIAGLASIVEGVARFRDIQRMDIT